MQLFYHPDLDASNKHIAFNKDESRHIQKVLRKQEGDVIHSTNGKGEIFALSLTLVSPKLCEAEILEVSKKQPLPYRLHLAVAPTKNNDRFEWFLEKATEIGVTQITPLLCSRSERKHIKLERFEKIIVSAMKQSLKAHLPVLNPLTSFDEFIKQNAPIDGLHCIAHCEDTPKESLKNVLTNQEAVTIIIGPEGDVAPDEIELALKHNFTAVSLGEQRLRTETAAVVACNTVSLFCTK
ncbi:MAG: 16S rRNA (uracil(1498)-N(3))-methyltransferase [Gilvibacter sp.]